MTGYKRFADVQLKIFEPPTVNGCFAGERPLAQNGAMSVSRTKPPVGYQRIIDTSGPNRPTAAGDDAAAHSPGS